MDLFGPLDKKYCNLFLAYAIVAIIGMVAIVGVGVFVAIQTRAFPSMKVAFSGVSMLLMYGIMYLQSRLLYQMCLSK